jgi:hypothetical protein
LNGLVLPSESTPTSQINVWTIVASALGGALVTLILGLILFCIWRRISNKGSSRCTSSASSSTARVPPPLPPRPPASIVVPALYDLALSRRGSSETVTPQSIHHYYEETL